MSAQRKRLKELALQRVEILLENAVLNGRMRMGLAQKQAAVARRICEKTNLRLPYHLRQQFCRRCKRFILPGVNARVRVWGPPRAVRVTCLECGSTYRKILVKRLKT